MERRRWAWLPSAAAKTFVYVMIGFGVASASDDTGKEIGPYEFVAATLFWPAPVAYVATRVALEELKP